jgi:hypothetical protein
MPSLPIPASDDRIHSTLGLGFLLAAVTWSVLAPGVAATVLAKEPASGGSPGSAARTPVLPPLAPWDGKSRDLALAADAPWATPFEASQRQSSPSYDETVAWLQKLADASPRIHMVPLGTSSEERTVWMVIASEEGADRPQALRASGKATVLVQAGIHAGEIDGKDAGMMLLRDMTVLETKRSLLAGANLLFVPILNVDGHERSSPYSRINQRGPTMQGWRTNARNLNLNRDYTKLETPEIRAVLGAIRAWEPDLYIDVHVTDGVDYQYDVTFGSNGTHAWSPHIAAWLDEHFTPAVREDLQVMGHVPGPLIFATNYRDMTGGAYDWTAIPRFSHGYGDARHLPTILVENHSLKPFEQRVLGTYVFLESTLRRLATSVSGLRAAVEEDRHRFPDSLAVEWKVPDDRPPTREPFLGIRSRTYLSKVSGAVEVRWTGEPLEEEVGWIRADAPAAVVRRPAAYVIPAPWSDIADRLELHGIVVDRSETGFSRHVESLRLPHAALETENQPFKGRVRVKPGEIEVEEGDVSFPPGSCTVDTRQPLGDLAVLLLEPQSVDSFFQWGYFLEILQQTEYFEGYVMEPMARAMLEEDPDLAAAFERKLLDEPAFAGDPEARLRFFYERTPYFDTRWKLYPVARVLD